MTLKLVLERKSVNVTKNPSNLNTIQEEWENFSSHIFKNVNAPDIQKTEMRNAFFAGATTMMWNLQEIGSSDISEEDAAKFLGERLEEGAKYFEKFKLEVQNNNENDAERM